MRFSSIAISITLLLPTFACKSESSSVTPTAMQPATPSAGASGANGTAQAGAAGMTTSAGSAVPAMTAGAAGMALTVSAGSSAAGSGGAGASGTPAAGAGGAGANGASGAGMDATAGTTASAGTAGAAGAAAVAGAAGASGAPAQGATLGENDTLVPHSSWTCGMPDGIPPPKSGELAFEATLQLGDVHDFGMTQFGKRLLIEVKGGTLTGPNIKGTILDRGLDWQLTLPNGAMEVEQVNVIQTSDGAAIYFRNCGTAATADGEVRVVPDFEAPNGGPYAWLNTTKLAGVRKFDAAMKTMTMSLYKLPATAASGGSSVRVEEPAGLPDQTWECKKPMGRQGMVVYNESVGIEAGTILVGPSKRGTRNIIPITGGTTTGRVEGSVLSGGADFQLLTDNDFILDARYTLKTKDGQLIIVRNCGSFGGFVPVFEARADGPYAWLNANTWLSSDPGIGIGVVNLTIYGTN